MKPTSIIDPIVDQTLLIDQHCDNYWKQSHEQLIFFLQFSTNTNFLPNGLTSVTVFLVGARKLELVSMLYLFEG